MIKNTHQNHIDRNTVKYHFKHYYFLIICKRCYSGSNMAQSAIPVIAAAVGPRLQVAAIDFGTTYSGYAFAFRHEFHERPPKVKLDFCSVCVCLSFPLYRPPFKSALPYPYHPQRPISPNQY